MDNPTIIIASAIVSIFGAIITAALMIYEARAKRLKLEAEKEKLDADSDDAFAGAAGKLIEGASVSNSLLLQRITELVDRDKQRVLEFETKEKVRDDREAKLATDVNDLQEKLRNVHNELVLWKDYAIRLMHQLKAHRIEPVPFDLEQKVA